MSIAFFCFDMLAFSSSIANFEMSFCRNLCGIEAGDRHK